MREINLSAEQLVASLLAMSESEQVCFVDSCGVSHLGSHLLIAGINPRETLAISGKNTDETLQIFEQKLAENFASLFTISYEFGLKLNHIQPRPKEFSTNDEPDIFLAVFDYLIVHDYDTKQTFVKGNTDNFAEIEQKLQTFAERFQASNDLSKSIVESNFTRVEYLAKVEEIKEFIRKGETYQTNLTQQFRARLPENLTPKQIFYDLRKDNPAPFAAFLKRNDDFVISASPERFFRVESRESKVESEENLNNSRFSTLDSRLISTSPIKGTRPRGKTAEEDLKLKNELLNSAKDRAENVMIVDLLRNDLGRVCEFGSVAVEKLCDLEEHPTLFHLVSTVTGKLRENTTISDIIRAVFPCGSITGAPKISTMQIIDRLETANRGLSMGAIGICSRELRVESRESKNLIPDSRLSTLDLSVAIRTMTIKDNHAVFNVGGGIVIDSNAAEEYEEMLTKAKAPLNSINGEFDF